MQFILMNIFFLSYSPFTPKIIKIKKKMKKRMLFVPNVDFFLDTYEYIFKSNAHIALMIYMT